MKLWCCQCESDVEARLTRGRERIADLEDEIDRRENVTTHALYALDK